MKYVICLLTAALPLLCLGQGGEQRLKLEGAKSIRILASFSSVEVRAGGDAVVINHLLTVEGEDRPDLRDLKVSRSGATITIEELEPTVETLQQRFGGEGGGLSFYNSDEREGGRHFGNGNHHSIQVDAILKLTVPEGVSVEIETLYGSIDANDVAGLQSAEATYGTVDVVYDTTRPGRDLNLYSNYGAVDLTLPPGTGADLELITEYGDLFTNTEIAVDPSRSKEEVFYQRTVGRVGSGGVSVRCRAPYGDVYFRLER